MHNMWKLGFLLLCLALSSVHSFKYYQTLIPNGDKVQHPCLANKLWVGVGHFSQEGGGARNPFGVDFKNEGGKWNRALCMKDSDGDGRSNGDELGDPECTWKKGGIPTRTSNITHPGVCEPITSATCKAKNKADWDLCKSDKFVCNATSEPNVTRVDFRMKHMTVPKKITNYYCQAFALPNTTQHMIALEPIINNTNVMHHILLFGCTSKPKAKHFLEPYECGMAGTGCSNIFSGWTLGAHGDCLHENTGVKIGKTGIQYMVMQVHWNNPELRADYTDSSGVRFYLTPKLRKYESSLLIIGQRYLEIPPGHAAYRQEAECTSACTSRHLPNKVYLVNLLPHMHYAGRFSQVTHYHNGTKPHDLLPYSEVSYDEPKEIKFKSPVEFNPGDRLHIKCDYKTTTQKNIIYYGDATADEMCFGFVRYYPAQTALTSCVMYGPIDWCTLNDIQNGGDGKWTPGRIGNCSSFGVFMGATMPKVWGPQVTEHCDFSIPVCRPKCKTVVKKLNQDPCWQGWAKKYAEFLSTLITQSSLNYLRSFLLAVNPCSMEIARENGVTTEIPTGTRPPLPPGMTNHQKTVLIGVGAGVVGLLLTTVVVFGMHRALHTPPTANVGRGHSYLAESQGTKGIENGYNNEAGPFEGEPEEVPGSSIHVKL